MSVFRDSTQLDKEPGLDEQRPGAEVPGLFGFLAKSSEGDLVGFGNRRSILVVGKIGENHSTGTVKVV